MGFKLLPNLLKKDRFTKTHTKKRVNSCIIQETEMDRQTINKKFMTSKTRRRKILTDGNELV